LFIDIDNLLLIFNFLFGFFAVYWFMMWDNLSTSPFPNSSLAFRLPSSFSDTK